MAKINVTRKWVYNNFDNIICAPYCSLQELLKDMRPSWYTSGLYGWNADIYIVDMNTCIVTGHRPFGDIKPPHDILALYDNSVDSVEDFVKEVLSNV